MASNCSSCKGSGWFFCAVCRGVGTTLSGEKCGNCRAYGYTECQTCRGTGELQITTEKCWACKGTGNQLCDLCGGDGDNFDYHGELKKCERCDGRGLVKCVHCFGQRVSTEMVSVGARRIPPTKVSVETRAAKIQEEARIAEAKERERKQREAEELARRRKYEQREKVRKAIEVLEADRRSKGLCEKCGKRLGLLARWRGTTRCKEHKLK